MSAESRRPEGWWMTMTWVPQACTLPTAEQPLRAAEFDTLFAATVRPASRPSPTRLRVFLAGGPAAVAFARDLIARETACCSFFSFTLRASDTGSELDVGVPESQMGVLDAMQERAEAARVASAGSSELP